MLNSFFCNIIDQEEIDRVENFVVDIESNKKQEIGLEGRRRTGYGFQRQ